MSVLARSLVVAALALPGLVLAAPTGAQIPGPTVDPHILDGSAQRALDTAKARWRALRITNYRMRVALGCFCPEEIRAPRTITVRRGSPLRPPSHLREVATVPRLFRTVQRAIDGKVASIDVRYGKRGVPSAISIDRSLMIADEESYYTIDRFTRLRR